MSDFLQTMAARSAERAASVGPFASADFDKPVIPLSLGRFDIIAELKDRSPAEGALTPNGSPKGTGYHKTQSKGSGHPISEKEYGNRTLWTEFYGNRYRIERARAYADGGAAAISVLTEPSRFDGALEHLEQVAGAVTDIPVMRKDFLVAKTQILEARRAGASGVLLIATMLNDATLRAMLDCAFEHGMFVLLESFDEDDLRRSVTLHDTARGQLLIGVNTRDLRTLDVDANRLQRLAPLLPDARCVAESGLLIPEDAARVSSWGYNMALVGTALMRSEDPQQLVAAMRQAGA